MLEIPRRKDATGGTPCATASARRILDAWAREDMTGFRAELRAAQRPHNALATEENERLELLNGVAAQMERDLSGMEYGEGAALCFRLLGHLAAARPTAIRSETPSSSRYSQSGRRISASR